MDAINENTLSNAEKVFSNEENLTSGYMPYEIADIINPELAKKRRRKFA